MTHIFISYSRKDLAIAEKIINALAKDDLEPWIDWKSIPKGETFEREIQQGIEKAEIFLFLVSPDSVQSDWCNMEIAHAVKNGKRILPIVIRDADIKNIHPEISKRNWIFCRKGRDDFNTAIEEARKTIRTDYEWLKYHTELQVKALKWEQKKDTSRLLRGKELREAEQQLAEIGAQEDPQLTKIQRKYILSSQRNEVRTRRQITISLSVGLAVMIAISIFAWIQRNTAVAKENARATAQANAITESNARATAQFLEIEQRNIAYARQIAVQAQAIFNENNYKQQTSVLLAIQSVKLYPLVDATQILSNNILAHPITGVKHENGATALKFSADGKYIVSGGKDGSVFVWDPITGLKIASMSHTYYDGFTNLITTANRVNAVDFSIDERYVISGSSDGTARIWEIASETEIIRVTHGKTVTSAAFSSDGKYAVSAGCDIEMKVESKDVCTTGTIRVWEFATGKEIARMTHDGEVTSIDISPDGQYVVSGGSDKTVRVWEFVTGKEVARMIHDDTVISVIFSLDGKNVVSGSSDNTARVWEIVTGKEISRTTHDSRVTSVDFSPDGNYVVSGSWDNTARVWETVTGKEISRMTHDGGVTSVAFSPDGEYVASGNYMNSGGTGHVWSSATGKEVARIVHDFPGYTGWDNIYVAFSPNGNYIISGSDGLNSGIVQVWKIPVSTEVASMIHSDNLSGTIATLYASTFAYSPTGEYIVSGEWSPFVWETETGMEVSRMDGSVQAHSLVFSKNGKYVISGHEDGTVRVWDVMTGKVVIRMNHGKTVWSVAASLDGKYIISGGADDTARVWDATTGNEISRMTHDDVVRSVAFSPDGKYALSSSEDGITRVWEATTGLEYARMTSDRGVNSVAFSPDGKYVAYLAADSNGISVLEVATNTKIAQMVHSGRVTCVTFSPDGKYIILGSEDGTARVWEVNTSAEISRITQNGIVNSVAFSPDGKYVASGDDEGNIRVWEPLTGVEIARTSSLGNWSIKKVAFSPDGKYVTSSDEEGYIRVWIYRPEELIENACLQVMRNLTEEEWKQYIGNALPYQAICPNLPIEP